MRVKEEGDGEGGEGRERMMREWERREGLARAEVGGITEKKKANAQGKIERRQVKRTRIATCMCVFTWSEAKAGQTNKIPHKKSSPKNSEKKMTSVGAKRRVQERCSYDGTSGAHSLHINRRRCMCMCICSSRGYKYYLCPHKRTHIHTITRKNTRTSYVLTRHCVFVFQHLSALIVPHPLKQV